MHRRARHLQTCFHQFEDSPLYRRRPAARVEYFRMHSERVDFSAPVPGRSLWLILWGFPRHRIETLDNAAILLRGQVNLSQIPSDTASKMDGIGLYQPVVNDSPFEWKQRCFDECR